MKPFTSNAGAIVAINLQLLSTFGCGITAWAIWPQKAEWWGLGLFSVILWCGAFGSLVNALKLMFALRSKKQVLAAYMAQGAKPKSAQMASADDLRRAGMIE